MIKNVVDTHRLMYRNARIRAFDLSDRTTAIPFYNVTDQILPAEDIGYEVRTDAAGYVYYGVNAQPVQCLAVAKSAIIQVDLTGSGAWDIEWVLHMENESDFVKVNDIHKVFYADGSLAWDPLIQDWQLPDFALKSDIGRGEWAEGEMIVSEETPKDLNIDKWTHVVTLRNGHTGEYRLLYSRGRYGQTIRFINASRTDCVIIIQRKIAQQILHERILVKPNQTAEAAWTDHVGWYMMTPVEPIELVNSTWTFDSDSALCNFNYDANPSIKYIEINKVPADKTLYITYSQPTDDGKLSFVVINNTGETIRLCKYYLAGQVYVAGTPFDYIQAHKTETIIVYTAYLVIQNGHDSNFPYVAVGFDEDKEFKVVSTHTQLIYTKYWARHTHNGSATNNLTVTFNTDMYGTWFPFKLVLGTNGDSIPGTDNVTLNIVLNGATIYTKTITPNDATGHTGSSNVFLSGGRLILSGEIRVNHFNSDGSQLDILDTDFVDFRKLGGDFA